MMFLRNIDKDNSIVMHLKRVHVWWKWAVHT